MAPKKRRRLSCLLVGGILTLFSILFLRASPEMGWELSFSPGYSFLEYTHKDGNPENVCNCSAIMLGESEAIQQAKILTITKDFKRSMKISEDYYINATKDCWRFRHTRKYLTFSLSQEEEDFTLAYSIVVHHKVQTFERLLRAIYAPQNIYCVHVDIKAQASVLAAIISITSCFPNVFMASMSEEVIYAGWPRVQADINCMSDLYKGSTKWKYFINLCGQDFPLKTNLEIVRSLRLLNGGNSMESEQMPEGKKWRWKTSHQIVDGKIKTTGQAKEPPPFNIPIMSGNAYIVASRGYVRSVLTDHRVQALIEWAKDTYSPDEFLWATIQRMPGVPGSTRPSSKYDLTDMHAIARVVKWEWHEGSDGMVEAAYPVCQGSHVRAICVYGAGDLQWLLEQHHIFANKFDMETDAIAIYCLEKYLRHRALAALH